MLLSVLFAAQQLAPSKPLISRGYSRHVYCSAPGMNDASSRGRSYLFAPCAILLGCNNPPAGDPSAAPGAEKSSTGKTAPTAASPAGSAPTSPSGEVIPTQVAFGNGTVFYRSADGSVRSWGFGGALLGDGSKEKRTKPAVVADLAGTERLATGGGQTMCAVMKDGSAKCWGNGQSGELGDAKAHDADRPTTVPGLAGVTDIGIGSYYACALLKDGTVKCWGSNSHHQAGPSKEDKLVPPTAIPGVAGARQIGVGGDTACALSGDGALTCWGLHASGESSSDDSDDAMTVAALAGSLQIAGGWEASCAVDKSRSVQCWGDNALGQLGIGSTANEKRAPVKGLTNLAGALDVRTDALHTTGAAKKGAALFCELLSLLATSYPRARRIHLIVDNYGIHSAHMTRRALLELGGRIVLHFLPPYCPDANRIERVWQDLHANVTRNHRCRTLNLLLENARRYLNGYIWRRVTGVAPLIKLAA